MFTLSYDLDSVEEIPDRIVFNFDRMEDDVDGNDLVNRFNAMLNEVRTKCTGVIFGGYGNVIVEDQNVGEGDQFNVGRGVGQAGGRGVGQGGGRVGGRGRGRGGGRVGGRGRVRHVDVGNQGAENIVEYVAADNARFAITQANAEHPLFVVQMNAMSEEGVDMGTKLVFEKKSSYIIAVRAGEFWCQPQYLSNDITYCFNGVTEVDWGVSYIESGGIEGLKKVGIGPLRRALLALASGGDNEWRKNYHIVCSHIAEAARFYSIANRISETFTGFDMERSVQLDDNEQELVKNWSQLSKMVLEGKWDVNLTSKLGIPEPHKLPTIIAMLKAP